MKTCARVPRALCARASATWERRARHTPSRCHIIAADAARARKSHRVVDGNGGRDWAGVAHQPDASAHESHRIPDDLRVPEVDERRKKKSVALLLAYVGGGYRGNTHNSQAPRGTTVDDVVEDALFQWGGILLPNYRSRGLQRLKWSRSSRTDKGVSSLCTVVSLRAEIDPAVWDRDPEARETAREITRLLPDDVECFAVYNTPKSFQARRECVMRTYEYLLPARVLDLGRDGAAVDESGRERLKRLNEALSCFVGSHAFHNYTKRSQYTAKAKSTFRPKLRDTRGNVAWRGQEGAVMDDGSEEEGEDEDEEPSTATTSEEEDRPFPKYVGDRSRHTYWLLEPDWNDKVGQSHFRRIHNFHAGTEIERMEITNADGSSSLSEPFIRISVRGESFMLYQIRKMIATAVAVSLGYCPLEFLPASLARPCRAAMPLAPASTLYLYDVEFMNFRKNTESGEQPNRLEKLVPSAAVREDLARFRRDKLEPALAPALELDEWDAFRDNLRYCNVTPETSSAILDVFETYKANKETAVASASAADAADAERLS